MNLSIFFFAVAFFCFLLLAFEIAISVPLLPVGLMFVTLGLMVPGAQSVFAGSRG